MTSLVRYLSRLYNVLHDSHNPFSIPLTVDNDKKSTTLVVAGMSIFITQQLLPRLEAAGVDLTTLSVNTLQLVITCPANFTNVRKRVGGEREWGWETGMGSELDAGTYSWHHFLKKHVVA